MRVAVIGHVEWIRFARVEHVPRPGEIAHGLDQWEQAGGAGAVAAVQLALLADEAWLFTALGDDDLGRRAQAELEGRGVVVHAGIDERPQRWAFTHVDDAGERTITTVGPKLTARGHDERLPWHELASMDAVFFVAGVSAATAKFAALARQRIAEELGLIAPRCYRFCWIVDFPMYEWDEQEKRVTFSHNPFSMPQGGLAALETGDPLEILAYQYDIVCNGVELSSGAIRNHRPDIMIKAFELAGYGRDVLEARFGGMFRALHYGAPPHGGLAPGIDRIVMLIAKVPNLREVTAFPLNQQAEELLLGAPSPVDEQQLKELHLQLSLAARERLREEHARAGPAAATADHLVSPHAG